MCEAFCNDELTEEKKRGQRAGWLKRSGQENIVSLRSDQRLV